MKKFVFSSIRIRLILIFFVALVPIMLLIGYNVREQRIRTALAAGGGAEAVALLERERDDVSLALLDVVMPRMGGREAYKAMLRISPGLKGVLMSGYADAASDDESPALQTPVPLLAKPFAPAELARKVREVLDAPA